MKSSKLCLAIFIDAFGWQILQRHPSFFPQLHKKELRTLLGYSNTCDPSIISGLLPYEHYHWSSFFYAPKNSPFAWTKWLRYLPPIITRSQRVRGKMSQLIQKIHGFTGYFQIYQMPFDYLPLFDYGEKNRIWEPKGLNKGRSIFDELSERQIPYHIDDSAQSDIQKIQRAHEVISSQSVSLCYILLGKLDAVMHAQGTQSQDVSLLIDDYAQRVNKLYEHAQEKYQDVNLLIFSDHGMHDIHGTVDLQSTIAKLNLTFGKDYVAMYDSTMARFWFLNNHARQSICKALGEEESGRFLSKEELEALGVYFPDGIYGEEIFLVNPGVLIIPSFMGLKPIPGMHGYHPDEKDAAAMLMSNAPIPDKTKGIEDIFSLLLQNSINE